MSLAFFCPSAVSAYPVWAFSKIEERVKGFAAGFLFPFSEEVIFSLPSYVYVVLDTGGFPFSSFGN